MEEAVEAGSRGKAATTRRLLTSIFVVAALSRKALGGCAQCTALLSDGLAMWPKRSEGQVPKNVKGPGNTFMLAKALAFLLIWAVLGGGTKRDF